MAAFLGFAGQQGRAGTTGTSGTFSVTLLIDGATRPHTNTHTHTHTLYVQTNRLVRHTARKLSPSLVYSYSRVLIICPRQSNN